MSDRSDLVIQYFNYLILEFGFHIEQKEFDPQIMGNTLITFISPEIGIEIVIDKNQVLLTIGDQKEIKEKWLEFTDVIHYFSPSEVPYIFYTQTDTVSWDEAVEAQLKRVAFMLRQYCTPLLQGDLTMKEKIKKIEAIRVSNMLERYKKGTID